MNEQVNMARFIAPKSDQINADDLIGGPRTIVITRVTGNEGNAEQPVNVFFEGDDNKPFRPCKSMRRVMVKIWGSDASKYVGKAMTIFRDPKVKWGGMEVGGIRISHMTGLDKPEVMALTETRSARKPYTVQPLKVEAKQDGPREWANEYIETVNRAPDAEKLNTFANSRAKRLADLEDLRPELHAECVHALENKRAGFVAQADTPPVDGWVEGPADEQRGEHFSDADDGDNQ